MWPWSLAITSTGWVGLLFSCFRLSQELPKAQLAVVLVLNRHKRRGHGLKSQTQKQTSNSSSRKFTNIMENHDTMIAFEKKLDIKILVSFLSYKANIYIFHRNLRLHRTRSIDPNLGLLHNKEAYPCNKGDYTSLTMYNVCNGAKSLAERVLPK